MEIKYFLERFLQLSITEMISFVSENRRSLKLLFINAPNNVEVVEELRKILSYLSRLMVSASVNQKHTPEIQFLYAELGLYFKRNDNYSGVSNCIGKIMPSVLKNRLDAWIHYQLYNDISDHINSLPKYLEKISAALNDGDETYENEVIRDINTYYLYAVKNLSELGSEVELEAFQSLFNSDEIAIEYPILVFYRDNRDQFDLNLEPNELVNKVFEPSLWADRLFKQKFLDPIKRHPETVWYHILMGYTFNEIKSTIINFGQTDFDKEVLGLSGLDMTQLYAYCNMRMHFFAALHLFERSDIFATLYKSPGTVKFIDIGCGPATSGLAFIDHISERTGEVVSFDYVGVDYFAKMRAGAEYFMNNDVFQKKEHAVYLKRLDELDFGIMEKANSIFINTSYLFASEYLDEAELARDVLSLRRSNPDCPCYLIFQNATGAKKNAKYFEFKKHVADFKTIYTGNPQIPYSNQRNSYSSTPQQVFQEILSL